MSTTTLTTYYCNFCDIVANFFSTKTEELRQKRTHNSGIEQLKSMSDIQLKDIGLCRGDISAVARGEYVRPAKW